jgi:hypothetical protein
MVPHNALAKTRLSNHSKVSSGVMPKPNAGVRNPQRAQRPHHNTVRKAAEPPGYEYIKYYFYRFHCYLYYAEASLCQSSHYSR